MGTKKSHKVRAVVKVGNTTVYLECIDPKIFSMPPNIPVQYIDGKPLLLGLQNEPSNGLVPNTPG